MLDGYKKKIMAITLKFYTIVNKILYNYNDSFLYTNKSYNTSLDQNNTIRKINFIKVYFWIFLGF